MDLTLDFASAQEKISAALVNTTRAASQISAEDVVFHRSSNADVARLLDDQNARLLALAEQLLRNAASIFRNKLVDIESIDSHWGTVVDTVDNLLERSDTCLDEYSGRFINEAVEQQSDSSVPRARLPKKSTASTIHNLPKPQLLFEHPPNNNESQPFRPLISSKPHAVVPFEHSFSLYKNENDTQQHQHPYQAEIEQYQYPPFLYTEAEPVPYLSFEDTQATFVDDYEGVLEMLEELKNATEIAIDLEHHDTHSYVGIVSLMQISTRSHDWIVDTLKPWRRKLEVLNEVFADSKILKVFHGAHMDITWLQRDLGLYIVGLFDTYHASRVLGYSGGSLAFLLKKFINFDAQKQYQLADWRMRPLPAEMFDYARSDTHFLLYIYDHMRNELIQRSRFNVDGGDRIQDVLERSKEYALQQFEHFVYDENRGGGRGGWVNLLMKNNMRMSKEQFAVFRKVHQWRDTVSRREDQNVNLTMPGHVLFNIVRALPHDQASLFTVSHPISQAMRLHAGELVGLIQDTIATAGNEPEMQDMIKAIQQSDPSQAWKSTTAIPQAVVDTSREESPVNGHRITAADADIRSSSSSFWGPTLNAVVLDAGQNSVGASITPMELPFQRHYLENLQATSTETEAAPPVSSRPVSDGGREEDLPRAVDGTPSQSNGKRKAAQAVEEVEPLITSSLPSSSPRDLGMSHGGETPLVDDVAKAGKRDSKRARKAMKQKAGEMDNETRGVDGIAETGSASLQPFDYSAAPSVLHAAKSSQPPNPGKKPFNPYAKAADAAGGMKKAQEFKTGKSWTFKH